MTSLRFSAVHRAACVALVLTAPSIGCKDKSIGLGRGEAVDARLYADVYTWTCSQEDTGGGPSEVWEGVYAYNISFEYAPDGLVDRSLPESGCSPSLDIFPLDAGASGYDLEATPSWYNSDDYEGVMQHENTGFYSSNVFSNAHSCAYPDDVLAAGTQVLDAGVFSGASTPSPGTLASVVDGVEGNEGINFGDEVAVTWDASGWDESWVQVRREKNGALVQGLTCRTTGDSAFTIDTSVWSQMSDAMEVDLTNIYVGFGKRGGTVTSDGQEIQTWTREMHTAVVQD